MSPFATAITDDVDIDVGIPPPVAPVDPCDFTDLFERTVAAGWGNGWQVYSFFGSVLPDPATIYVNGTQAVIEDATVSSNDPIVARSTTLDLPIELVWHLTIPPVTGTFDWSTYLWDSDFDSYGSVELYEDAGALVMVPSHQPAGASTVTATYHTLTAGTWAGIPMGLRLRVESAASRARIWPLSGAEPSVWQAEHTTSGPGLVSAGDFLPSSSLLAFEDGNSILHDRMSICPG